MLLTYCRHQQDNRCATLRCAALRCAALLKRLPSAAVPSPSLYIVHYTLHPLTQLSEIYTASPPPLLTTSCPRSPPLQPLHRLQRVTVGALPLTFTAAHACHPSAHLHCSPSTTSCPRSPPLQPLNHLQRVAVRVTEEDGRPTALARRERHPLPLQRPPPGPATHC
jgi:hypothetical protein